MAGLGSELLTRLLDSRTGEVPPPRQFSVRNQHRQAEFTDIATPVELSEDLWHADATVTKGAVKRLRKLFERRQRIVPWSHCVHSTGELAHYFNGVWVLSGVKDSHERMVFHRIGLTSTLVPLHHCSGHDQKAAYTEFLDMLEHRWCYIKSGPAPA